MSAEESVTDALQEPVGQNAEATEDAKKLLAELQAGEEEDPTTRPESNGDNAKAAMTDGNNTEDDVKHAPEEDEAGEGKQEHRESPAERKTHERRGVGGGSYRGRGVKPKNFRDNIKSDLTTQETSNDPVAIRKQVEFYFSDSNLPMDKFLLEKVGGSKNNAVEISILHSFKRMRHFQPLEAIIEALKDSSTLELTDDDTKVRRKEPLPSTLDNGIDVDAIRVFEDKAMPRSVYVKGFGDEAPSTQFDIEAFFTNHGPTNAIRLRRNDTKNFKGSVFVEFETEELATKFLEQDPKPKFQGKDLLIMSKKEYCDKKVEDIKAGKIKAGKDRSHGHRSHRGGGRFGGRDKRKRDDEDDRDWRTRREEDRKNGFRDDKRRHQHDRRFNDKQQDSLESKSTKDDRGVPVVKATTEADREKQKAEALARAKAVVEAQNKKRERGEEDAAGEPAAKRVDSKED